MAQRLHRRHPGRDPGGEESGAAPDQGRDPQRQRRVGAGDGHALAERPPQPERPGEGEGEPRGAAEGGEDGRFEQDFGEDVAVARPQGLADPDLARPLGHAHQHHVHDDDAGHQERQRADGDDGDPDDADDAEEKIAVGLGDQDVEIVGLPRPQAAQEAQGHARPLERLLEREGGEGLQVDGDRAPVPPDLLEGPERHVGDPVEGGAETGPLSLLHADDLERAPPDPEGAADRVAGGEEFVDQVLPDDDDGGGAPAFRLGEEPPRAECDVADRLDFGGGPVDGGGEEGPVARLDVGDGRQPRGRARVFPRLPHQDLGFAPVEFRVPPQLVGELPAVEPAGGGDAGNGVGVRTDGLGRAPGGDVADDPERRADQDDGGDPDDDAEDRERRPELVRPEGAGGDPEGIAEGDGPPPALPPPRSFRHRFPFGHAFAPESVTRGCAAAARPGAGSGTPGPGGRPRRTCARNAGSG